VAGVSGSRSATPWPSGTSTTTCSARSKSKQLTPRLRISCRPLNPGADVQRLEVALLGPPDLDAPTGLTVTIRDDRDELRRLP
jgi:hypothetical protein